MNLKSEGKIICLIGFLELLDKYSTDKNIILQKQYYEIDLNRTSKFLSTQLIIDETTKQKNFYMAFFVPMTLRSDLKIGNFSLFSYNL